MMQICHSKITPRHLARKAVVYLRQSSEKQVLENQESQRLQYALVARAQQLGWSAVEVIDTDLGSSAAMGAPRRKGFERLLAAVALGEVGMILSREVSRLSRTDKDWCHLLELCQLFGTLLADDQQIYDIDLLDDQLVLGIKGTLSVVELKVLNMRLVAGMEAKAKRGELVRRLPPGYVHDCEGKVVKDPNRRVQEAMALVFSKFREIGSMRQTYLWFRHHEVELPVNRFCWGKSELAWRIPTRIFVENVLRSPTYAGAYTYGRHTTEKRLEKGRIVRRHRRICAAQDCRVFLRDHHEGYISWETYEENQAMIRRNAVRGETEEGVGAIRAGQGLFAGLFRCARCGRKLHVRYAGARGTGARYLCRGDFDVGGKYCLGFGGATVDRELSQEVIRVISPLGIQASLEAANRGVEEKEDCLRAVRREIEEREFEVRRAFEQYNEVDPRHRLVAAELEQRWNDKLEKLQASRARLQEEQAASRNLTEEERSQILELGKQFSYVWEHPRCSIILKKKMIRTVIEEIVVHLEDTTQVFRFVIHWKGGCHTEFVTKKRGIGPRNKTQAEDVDLIRRMAVRYGDDEIARVLNHLGRTTGKGKPWNEFRVRTARRRHDLPGHKRRSPDPEILSLGQATRHTGVSDRTLLRLGQNGVLPMKQVCPWAPWEIRKSDLDSPPVAGILDHLRKTGNLILPQGTTENQPSLFQ